MNENIMNRYKLIILVLAILFPAALPAQNVNITGKVQDESGAPLVGVTVYQENNTSNGSATDADGVYRLSVPQNSSIVVSFLAFVLQTVRTGRKRTINVTL